jgi:methyl-accepting chemotaxis protein
MSFKTKVLAVLLAILMVSGAAGAAVVAMVSAQRPALEALDNAAHRLATTATPLVRAVDHLLVDVPLIQQWLTDVAATGTSDGYAEAESLATDARLRLKTAVRLAHDNGLPEVVRALETAQARFGPWYDLGRAMADAYRVQGRDAGNALMPAFDTEAEALSAALATAADLATRAQAETLAAVTTRTAEAGTSADDLTHLVIALTALGGFVALVGGAILVRLVNGVVSGLEHDVAVIAANGAVPLRLTAGRKDEFGRIGGSLEQFRKALAQAAAAAKDQAEQDLRAADDRRALLERLANDLHDNVQAVVDGITSAVDEMHATAEAMSDTASETSEQADMVSTAAEQAAANVHTVAAAAEHLSSSIAEINRQVDESSDISKEAVEKAARASDIMNSLSVAAERIGEVVALITDIAEQTNLLALNATIEAARAGDAGKGFAVVASEVKNLANQTSKATEDIARQIGGVQSATEEAVSAIGEITTTIDRISTITDQIARAMDEQDKATQDIARNVAEASTGTQQVTHTIGTVTMNAQETGQAARQVLASSDGLARQADLLQGRIAEVAGHIRAA